MGKNQNILNLCIFQSCLQRLWFHRYFRIISWLLFFLVLLCACLYVCVYVYMSEWMCVSSWLVASFKAGSKIPVVSFSCMCIISLVDVIFWGLEVWHFWCVLLLSIGRICITSNKFCKRRVNRNETQVFQDKRSTNWAWSCSHVTRSVTCCHFFLIPQTLLKGHQKPLNLWA